MATQNIVNKVPTMEELEEDKDKETVNPAKMYMHEFYEIRNVKKVGQYIATGEVFAHEIFEHVLDKAVIKIYEKYLHTKQTPHVVRATSNLVELVLGTHMSMYDNQNFIVNNDDEPVSSPPTRLSFLAFY
jgi:hypothetical protein